MKNYRGSRIVIIGLGKTGLSCVKFFLDRGVIPQVIDSDVYTSKIYNLPYFVQYFLGGYPEEWIFNATLIVVSPGVRLDHPVLIEALNLGIEIVGDIELFVREATAPIIAITGSNGKSTVTQLVGNMAKRAGWFVGIAGNIGIPVLTLLEKSYQLYVLEISSFQLDVTYSLRATAAIILNISEDHIDRYPGGLKQYCLSKKRIYRNAAVCVVNILDSLITFAAFNKSYDNGSEYVTVSINSDLSHYHLEYYKGNNWIVAYDQYLLNCSEIKISGCIGYMNALSALALSDVVKIPRIASLTALRQFSGLPHRFQLIYKNRDISWINDSKATNVSATTEAINNAMMISSSAGVLHLLLGGDGKKADFSSLKYLIKKRNINIYCFGKDGLILTELGYNHVFLTDTMKEAMYIISQRAQRRDIVLLSPACSSLDQFISFKARGFFFTYFAREFG